MQLYKLITFDITGTILKFKHPPGIHYAEAGARFGIIGTHPEILTDSFKKQWKHLNSTKPNFGLQHNGWEKWWGDAVHGTFTNAGYHCDAKILDDIAQYLITKYTTPSCWQLCDGAIDLLSKLKAQNIPLGVVSNFDARLDTILQNMNVRHYFDFVVTSYQAGHTKPDPRIFEKALENHSRKLVPSEILHVGDTHELDCEGARRAGWDSWLVSADCDNDKAKDTPTVGSLHKLHQHLQL